MKSRGRNRRGKREKKGGEEGGKERRFLYSFKY